MIGIGELLIILVVASLPIAGVVLMILLIRGTARETKMGVNFTPPSMCPKCNAPLPAIRAPKNVRQMLWGGWTCSGCGVELDKWGRPVG